MDDFADIFPGDLLAGLPPKRDIDHHIELVPGAKPPHRAPYRMSPKGLDELKWQLQDLTEKGYIQPLVSPFGAPVLFIPKKDGGMRMCIDYRALTGSPYITGTPYPESTNCWIDYGVPSSLRRSTCVAATIRSESTPRMYTRQHLEPGMGILNF